MKMGVLTSHFLALMCCINCISNCLETSYDDFSKQTNLKERVKFGLDTGLLSDCVFLVGNENEKKEFRAHKTILSLSSPVFAVMFNSSFKEKESEKSTEHRIELKDIEPETFSSFLTFLYTDQVEITSLDSAYKLIYISEKYIVPSLIDFCVEFILERLKSYEPAEVLRILDVAVQFNLQDLINVIQIVIVRSSSILEDSSLINIKANTLKAIIRMPRAFIQSQNNQKLVVSELTIFLAACSWITAETTNKGITDEKEVRKFAEEFLREIKYTRMTAESFAKGTHQYPLVSDSVSVAIFKALAWASNPVLEEESFWPKGWEH